MLATNPPARRLRTHGLIASLSRSWWILFVTGITSVVAGGMILFVHWSVGERAVLVGALFVVRGVLETLTIPLDRGPRGWAVTLGLLEVGVGLAVIVWPDPTLLVVATFIGWWGLFSGVTTVIVSTSARHVLPYWGLFLALGILGAAAGGW